MDDFDFTSFPFNNISVVSGRWLGDKIRLCAMDPRLQLKRFSPQAGLEKQKHYSPGPSCSKHR